MFNMFFVAHRICPACYAGQRYWVPLKLA